MFEMVIKKKRQRLHESLAVRLIKLTNEGLLIYEGPTRTNIKNENYDNNVLTDIHDYNYIIDDTDTNNGAGLAG